ncbi:MAG: helix-turn-helix domain-containing protein [Salinarimonas sp.]
MRIARDARGWSQADLAEKATLSTNSIGRLERGEMALRFDNIEKVAAALELEPSALFAPEPPVAPQPERARVLQRLNVLLVRMSDEDLARLGRVIRAVEG